MRLELEVELRDSPGQLSGVLDVVADHGGNIVSVLHLHEQASEGRVPVALVVEVPEPDAIPLIDAVSREHRVLSVDREGGPARATLMLVGHVFEADLRDLLNGAFDHGAEVDSVDARIEGREAPSAVLVQLSADREAQLRQGLVALKDRAGAAGLSIIEPAGGERRG